MLLCVRNANRRSATVTRMGDPHNRSKHQIAKRSQKQEFRAASCVSAKPLLRAQRQPPIRGGIRGAVARREQKKKRRFAAATWAEDSRDRPKRPASARNQKQLRAPRAPMRNRRFARPHTIAASRRKSRRHRFARIKNRRCAAEVSAASLRAE